MKLLCLIMLLNFLSLTSISQVPNGETEVGTASFYSNYFEGRKTACGEIFRQDKYTAAHQSLPFGTWVKVINQENNRSVIVCINDRGPFVKGRIIDLSESAAREIGNVNDGLFLVEIQIYRKDTHYIQAQKKSVTFGQRSEYLDFSLINP